MSSAILLDKTYNVIIKRLVKTGQAPHYTEIAAELGGTVEFWIGEGADAEKYEINRATSILIPKNTVHLPAYVTKLHKPFLMLSVLDAPIWTAVWSQSFPQDFSHAKWSS